MAQKSEKTRTAYETKYSNSNNTDLYILPPNISRVQPYKNKESSVTRRPQDLSYEPSEQQLFCTVGFGMTKTSLRLKNI